MSAIHKIRESKNRADVKAITKIIYKTIGTSFVGGYIAINISQLSDKKIITNVKTPQHLDSFRLSTTKITSENNLPLQVKEIVLDDTEHFRLSTTKITSENNLPLQVEEIVLDDTEQCQQNTHFVRNLLDDIINNAPGNLVR